MATTYYANSAGTNTAPYDTIAKGATDIQTVLDLCTVAGDMVRATGTFTLAAVLDIDQGQGSVAAGFCLLIGVTAGDVDDGTRVVIDGNSAVANCIKANNKDYWHLKNIEVKNATGDAIEGTSSEYYWLFENIYSHNNGGMGLDGTQFTYSITKSCIFENNTSYGVYGNYMRLVNCIAIGNGNFGFWIATVSLLYGCVAHNNTTGQIYVSNNGCSVINCVADGWTGAAAAGAGVQTSVAGTMLLYGSRITNNAIGVDLVSADYAYYDYCFLLNNTANIDDPGNSTLVDGGNNVTSGTEGYNGGQGGGGTDDFNLTTSATSQNTQIDLDGTNNFYITAGLPPVDVVPDYPDVGNVTEDDTVDGNAGTYHEPTTAEVIDGVTFGADSGLTGTASQDFPDVGNVTEDDTTGGSAGTYHEATEAEVENGVAFGAGSALTGSYTPDFPDVGNVTDDDTVNGVAGTYQEADATKYLTGNSFGEDGTEFDGTLELVSAPTAAVLSSPSWTDTIVFLEWTYSASVTSYQLWYKESGGVYARFPDASTTYSVLAATVTGLTASTAYVFKVVAVNGTGSTDSNELTVTTTAATPILTRIETALASLVDGMTTAGGYHFNWGDSNEDDKAVSDAKSQGYPNAEIRLIPQEQNTDDVDGNHVNAYGNTVTFEIAVHSENTAIQTEPNHSINAEHNKALDDLKRLFGLNPSVSDTANIILYRSMTRETSPGGDVMRPGKMITTWDVWYGQNRTSPAANAN